MSHDGSPVEPRNPAPARRRATRRKIRLPSLDFVLSRLTSRDIVILGDLYTARGLTTRQIATAYFPRKVLPPAASSCAPDAPLPHGTQPLWEWSRPFHGGRLGTPCDRCLFRMRRYGLIRTTLLAGTVISHISADAPLMGPLTPWGRFITVTARGLQVLARLDRLPQEVLTATGDPNFARESASGLRHGGGPHGLAGHSLLVAGAVLRAIAPVRESFTWIDGRHLSAAPTRRQEFIPDALIISPHHTWVVEGDKGTIPPATLVDRWQRNAPQWATLFQTGLPTRSATNAPSSGSIPPRGLSVPADLTPASGLPPLEGVLWFCAAETVGRLRRRLHILRLMAMGKGGRSTPLLLPQQVPWFVDTFDGLAWTWDRFLRPYTLGKVKATPRFLLEYLVARELGPAAPVTAFASLGNLTAWQRVWEWRTTAVSGRGTPYAVVLVRDEVERDELADEALQDGTISRMAFLIPDTVDPLGLSDHTRAPAERTQLNLKRLHWRQHAGAEWQLIALADLVSGRL